MSGSMKKKRRNGWLYGGIALVLIALIAVGLIAASSGGTKIDP